MRHDPLVWVPALLVGLAWSAFALVTWRRSKPMSVLGLAVAATWFAADVHDAAVMWHRAVLAHLLLAAPGWWPRTRLGRSGLVVAYLLALVPGAWSHEAFNAGVTLTLVVVVVWEGRIEGPGRRIRVAATQCAAGLGLVVAAGSVMRGVVPNRDAVLPALLGYEVAMLIIPAVLWSALHGHMRHRVTEVAIELSDEPERALRTALAEALDERQYQDGVRAAVRLQAAHDRLQEELNAQVTELAASRRRLLVAADVERARLRERLEQVLGERLDRIACLLDDAAPGQHENRARERLRDTSLDVWNLAQGLAPRQLVDGLGPALEWLAGTSRELPVEVVSEVRRHSAEVEAGAYFACSEALANALKHSGATRIRITARDCGDSVDLTVADDGRGGADPDGRGLTGVRDRVETLGGRLSIDSEPGRGTTLHARIGAS